jgi:hypothetical protein
MAENNGGLNLFQKDPTMQKIDELGTTMDKWRAEHPEDFKDSPQAEEKPKEKKPSLFARFKGALNGRSGTETQSPIDEDDQADSAPDDAAEEVVEPESPLAKYSLNELRHAQDIKNLLDMQAEKQGKKVGQAEDEQLNQEIQRVKAVLSEADIDVDDVARLEEIKNIPAGDVKERLSELGFTPLSSLNESSSSENTAEAETSVPNLSAEDFQEHELQNLDDVKKLVALWDERKNTKDQGLDQEINNLEEWLKARNIQAGNEVWMRGLAKIKLEDAQNYLERKDEVPEDSQEEEDEQNIERDLNQPVEAFTQVEGKLSGLSLDIHKLITDENKPFPSDWFDVTPRRVKINDLGKVVADAIQKRITDEMSDQVNGDMVKSLKELQKLFHYNNRVKEGAGVNEADFAQADMYRVFVTSLISRIENVVREKEANQVEDERSDEKEKSSEKAEQQVGRRKKFINRLRRAFVIGVVSLSFMLGIGDRATETNVDTNTGNEAGANTLVVEAAEEVEADDTSNPVIRVTVPQREVEPEITPEPEINDMLELDGSADTTVQVEPEITPEPTSETTPRVSFAEISEMVRSTLGEAASNLSNFAENEIQHLVPPNATEADVEAAVSDVQAVFGEEMTYPGTGNDRNYLQQEWFNAGERNDGARQHEIAEIARTAEVEYLSVNQAFDQFSDSVGDLAESNPNFVRQFFNYASAGDNEITNDDVQEWADGFGVIFENGINVDRTDLEQAYYNVTQGDERFNQPNRGAAVNLLIDVANGIVDSSVLS